MLVAYEVDILYLDLDTPVDGEIDAYGLPDYGILLDLGLYLAVQEALFGIILLNDVGRSLLDVIREFPAPAEVQPFLKILLLAGLNSRERPSGNPGPLGHHYFEKCGVSVGAYMVDFHRYIFEIALQPETAHDTGEFLAGDRYLHPFLETGQRNNLALAEIVVSIYADAADLVFDGTVIIDFHSPLLGKRHDC